jgi:hypothetical protein
MKANGASTAGPWRWDRQQFAQQNGVYARFERGVLLVCQQVEPSKSGWLSRAKTSC